MLGELDEVDRKILGTISENPEISQIELSELLKISQPAVSARIHKLRQSGVLTHLIGTNIRKSQLFFAKVDVITTEPDKLIAVFDKCPLYVNSFLTSGRYNLTVLLVAEDMRSIMSCVDSHLRTHSSIRDMEFNLIITSARDFIVPVKPIVDKSRLTPCGTQCESCSLYANNRCLGCPGSVDYKGNIL
jgi:Lrp/AsnC family leucine-responsive transcriptional regulator